MSRMQINALRDLVAASEGAGYTLPTELVNAYRTYTRLLEVERPTSSEVTTDSAATRLVSAAASAERLDPLGLATAVVESEANRQAAQRASEVLVAAVEQAGDAAVFVASDLTERIITEHLRPALEDVHNQAREVAAALDGYGLNTRTLVTAPAKVRNAYAKLPTLTDRRRAIVEARGKANAIGGRRPQQDVTNLFATFRKPTALFPTWQPPAQVPAIPFPKDPMEALLWIVSDEAAPAEPWLPTVAEQEAAWDAVFGEANQLRANAAKFSRGFANQ